MKRFLIAAGLVAFLPAVALAQGTSAQDAKVGSKNNGASPPAQDKSKRLTRDELRACMLLSDANQAEAVAIKEAQTAYFADLLPAKEALRKQRDWINEEGSALKKEQGELQKAQPTPFLGSILMEANVHGYDSTLAMYKWVAEGIEPEQARFTGGVLITREDFEQQLKDHGMWPEG